MATSVAQVNVRMDRDLKERGDATLSLAGSSPVTIIRQLWKRLALGGDAYERIMEVLRQPQHATPAAEAHQRVMRSASLFGELEAVLDENLPAFEPDTRQALDILEEAEWELLEERGLA